MNLFRTKYKFTHPKAGSPVYFKAWSERGAWCKYENFIGVLTHGKWALTWNVHIINRILSESECQKV